MTEIQKIKAKIASADFKAAIQALKSLAKGGSEENDVIQLEARFNRNERANRQGTLSTSEYKLECNKISAALLEVCTELEKNQKFSSKYYEDSAEEKYIIEQFQRVVGAGKMLSAEIMREIGLEFKDQLVTNEQIEEFCNKTNPNSQAPLLLNVTKPYLYANWIQYLWHIKSRSDERKVEITKFYQFIPKHLKVHYFELEKCKLFKSIEPLIKFNSPIKNQDLRFLSKSICEYIKILRDLEEALKKL